MLSEPINVLKIDDSDSFLMNNARPMAQVLGVSIVLSDYDKVRHHVNTLSTRTSYKA